MTRRRNPKSGTEYGFVKLPHLLMDTDDYRNLSANAIRLLNAMAYQYRGRNNGDLTASFNYMRAFGFRSKQTLAKAINDLLEANMIIRTRHGYFMNPGGKCALYALSWLPIDECRGKQLEVNPTRLPPRRLSWEKSPVQLLNWVRYNSRTHE